MIDEKKLIEALEEKAFEAELVVNNHRAFLKVIGFGNVKRTINKQPKVGEWIPCSERLPIPETEVLIVTKRKYRGGDKKYIVTTALYEDGTIRENDSCWIWEDIEGEWDEDEDCYIIPEGWWENRHYNPDDVYNNCVDDEVVAWMPLPEPFKGRNKILFRDIESEN